MAQPTQGGNAFEAVDYLVPIRLARDRNDHDRHLLSRFGQRRQQLSLPLGMPRPQMFVSQVQLVELEIHILWVRRQELRRRRLPVVMVEANLPRARGMRAICRDDLGGPGGTKDFMEPARVYCSVRA